MMRKNARFLVALLLIAGLVYQLIGAAQYLADRFQNKFWANRSLDAFSRSADGTYGGDVAAYISFLRDSIPEKATVLIPPGHGSGSLLAPLQSDGIDLFLMQYLLYPRRIETCPSDCNAAITEPGTYILASGDFPSPGRVPISKHLSIFYGTLGLYVPGK